MYVCMYVCIFLCVYTYVCMYVSKNFLGGMLCVLLKGGREIMLTYPGAFTRDVKSVLNAKSRWHPRWHPRWYSMLNEQELNVKSMWLA